MTDFEQLRITTQISAPVAKVWQTMIDPESYRKWTSVFAEGSYYEGTWEEGARIRFLSPSGDGMVATIEEYRLHEHISIRHEGVVHDGVEDCESEQVRSWAPAYEKYSFEPVDGGTQVTVEQDVTADSEKSMLEIWPKAFEALGALCEEDTDAGPG